MRRVVLAVAVALATNALFVSPAVAADTAACGDGSKVSRWKAHGKLHAGVAGVEAKLENQTLGLCVSGSDDDRGSAVWVSIDDNGAHPYNIAQVGIYKCIYSFAMCTGSIGTFYAWGRHNSVPGCETFTNVIPSGTRVGGLPAGTWFYEVVRTANLWKFKINGSVVDDIPAGSICWSRQRVSWAGESWDTGDAIGGSAGNPFRLSNAQWEPSVGGAWQAPNWPLGDVCNVSSGAKYKCNAVNGQAIDLWTVQP